MPDFYDTKIIKISDIRNYPNSFYIKKISSAIRRDTLSFRHEADAAAMPDPR